jgi:hypothetical protein
MSHHTATLQSTSATAFDFAYALADHVYWLDNHYIQPFYTWAAPHLRKVAISSLYWGLVALIDVSLWLTDTTRQFMARDAHAIALHSFAQAHAPLPELLALCPAAVPLALPSALPMASAPDLTADDDVDRVILIYPTVVPNAFSQFLTPGDSIQQWLTSALPLVVAPVPDKTSVVTAPQQDKPKTTGKPTAAAKTPRKRSTKKTAAVE